MQKPDYVVVPDQRAHLGVEMKLVAESSAKVINQVEAVSLGEEKPRAQGSGESAYSQNRRSDILYQGEY